MSDTMMNDKIEICLENISDYSNALINIPSNEQHIANIQSVISAALLEIKQCLKEIAMRGEENV